MFTAGQNEVITIFLYDYSLCLKLLRLQVIALLKCNN